MDCLPTLDENRPHEQGEMVGEIFPSHGAFGHTNHLCQSLIPKAFVQSYRPKEMIIGANLAHKYMTKKALFIRACFNGCHFTMIVPPNSPWWLDAAQATIHMFQHPLCIFGSNREECSCVPQLEVAIGDYLSNNNSLSFQTIHYTCLRNSICRVNVLCSDSCTACKHAICRNKLGHPVNACGRCKMLR